MAADGESGHGTCIFKLRRCASYWTLEFEDIYFEAAIQVPNPTPTTVAGMSRELLYREQQASGTRAE